jgi:hypothetical protein
MYLELGILKLINTCRVGFNKSPNDSNLYVLNYEEDLAILIVYVGDFLIVGNNNEKIEQVKRKFSEMLI